MHLAAAGPPIVGDPAYGRPRFERVSDPALKTVLAAFPRQALHPERITFRHPATNEPLTIAAPIPPDLVALFAAIDAASALKESLEAAPAPPAPPSSARSGPVAGV